MVPSLLDSVRRLFRPLPLQRYHVIYLQQSIMRVTRLCISSWNRKQRKRFTTLRRLWCLMWIIFPCRFVLSLRLHIFWYLQRKKNHELKLKKLKWREWVHINWSTTKKPLSLFLANEFYNFLFCFVSRISVTKYFSFRLCSLWAMGKEGKRWRRFISPVCCWHVWSFMTG